MFKIVLRLFSALYLVGLLLVVSLLQLFDDTLFFHSDAASMFVFTSAIAIPLAAAAALILAPLAGRSSSERLLKISGVVFASMLLGSLTFFIFDSLSRQFDFTVWLRHYNFEYAFFAFWVVALFIGFVTVFRSRQAEALSARSTRLARILTPFACAIFFYLCLAPRIQGFQKAGNVKHVVLIVLDAWPSYRTNTMNEKIPPRQIDSLFAKARIFRNVHTTEPWTHGYFGVLYRGSARHESEAWHSTFQRFYQNTFHSDWNLLSSLQARSVQTRWMVWHQAGIPESRAIAQYAGFRSVFFSDRYNALLNSLGLQFNSVILNPGIASLVSSQRRNWLFETLNPQRQLHNPLTQLLLPEMQRLSAGGRPSFLIFHFTWSLSTAVPKAVAWNVSDPEQKLQADNNTGSLIADRDYRYHPEESAYARQVFDGFDPSTLSLGNKLSDFVSAAKAAGVLSPDTLLIFTADHGQIAERGKLWYGFHPDEEVLRVPVIIMSGSDTHRVVDDRIFDTTDLARMIAGYFGVARASEPSATSLFSVSEKPFTVSITEKSDVNKQWYLLVYIKSYKYLFNIHPQGDAEMLKMLNRPGSLESPVIESGPSLLQEAKPFLKEALNRVGLSDSQIHQSFRNRRSETKNETQNASRSAMPHAN